MTITFPRDFPASISSVSGQTTLKRNQTVALTGDGPDVAEIAPPIWKGEYTIIVKGRAAIAEMAAWFTSLRGGLRTFKGIPVRAGLKLYRWPLMHPRGFTGLMLLGVQWNGLGKLSAIGAQRDTITINGIPNGVTLSIGDFVSFAIGSRQHLFKILEGGTSATNAVTVTVEPTVRPDAVTNGDVRFEYPYCDMVISGDYTFPENDFTQATASFQALQKTI